MPLSQIDLTGDSQPSPFDFAQALSVAEACAILFGYRVTAQTGAPLPGTRLVQDPALALHSLRSVAADTRANPRARGAASHALGAFFGLDVDAHPELLVQGVATLLRRAG